MACVRLWVKKTGLSWIHSRRNSLTELKEKGHEEKTLEKIWKDWEAFAQYAFNKSHSTCYSIVSYQTAYLKSHYPSEYMAAVLNHAGSIDKITFFMEECKRMGIVVLGPDINESEKGFTVNEKAEIRFGFGGMKGIGDSAIDNIIEERRKKGKFKDIFDLTTRVNLRAVSKKSLESLIYSGAFDSFTEYNRAEYMYTAPGDVPALEKITKFGAVVQAQAANNTHTLFGDMEMPEIHQPKLLSCPPWPLVEKLEFEKQVTGMYISGHPLDNFKFELNHYKITPLSDFTEIKNDIQDNPTSRTIRLAGLVTDAQHRLTRTGKNFAILQIEDYSGKEEFPLWSEDYQKYTRYLEKGCILFIEGSFRDGYRGYEFKINKIHLLETVKKTMTQKLIIDALAEDVDEKFVNFISSNAQEYPGSTRVTFNLLDNSSAPTR